MKKVLAIDLGGTNTRLAVIDTRLKILSEVSFPTRSDLKARDAVKEWSEPLSDLLTNHKISGFGIGSPGPLNTKTGKILETPNLSLWTGFSFTKYLEKYLHVPGWIENDANCAALGELAFSKSKNLIVLTLGTGVGSGVIVDGKLLTGENGLASEAGHICIKKGGPECLCGARGCLEACLGANYLTQKFDSKLSAKEIFEKHLDHPVVQEWVEDLAIGIGSLINIFNPKTFVLTGGLSTGLKSQMPHLQALIRAHSFSHLNRNCQIRISKLHNHGGLLGAACLAFSHLKTKVRI